MAYNNRGSIYSSKGQIDLAIKDYNKAIELKPNDASLYYNRGLAYNKKGKVDLAIKDFDKAIELSLNDADVYNNRGDAYGTKGEFDKAFTDFRKAIELKPDCASAYYNLGKIYSIKDELDLALQSYDKVIELRPDFANAYNNRGAIYEDKGEVNKAIKDYSKVIELKPAYTDAYNNRGATYFNKGEVDLAIKDFDKAIELNLDYAEAYNHRGSAYGAKGELDKAFADFRKSIELKPNNASTYYNLGKAYGIMGETDLALQSYDKAIEHRSDFANAYNNRGAIYEDKGEVNKAIKDYNKAIKLKPDLASAYNNRGTVYSKRGEINLAIKDYTAAIELQPNLMQAYYNRAEMWLRMGEWEKSRTDLIFLKNSGVDIIAPFHNGYKSVEAFEQRYRVKLPEDLALLLTQRRRTRYPKLQKVLDADGKPIESPNVVNLRTQLRDAGTPLGKYLKTKPAFGINIAPTEVFVVDKATRDKLIAAHPSSADILKPFLHGQDLRRWHVDTPHQWLIFTHRGIAINDYPAILEHLKKYREPLRKRKGKQEWYELPASLGNAERFAQPKLVCPDTYNHQTFAVDRSGYYYGNTSYLIPTEETWLCGLLNSRTVEWFYSQVSNQLTIDYLRARSGYIQQIPIPDLTSTQKALIAKLVDYLIYLQQQPTINSKDLAHARDHIMLGYFERNH